MIVLLKKKKKNNKKLVSCMIFLPYFINILTESFALGDDFSLVAIRY